MPCICSEKINKAIISLLLFCLFTSAAFSQRFEFLHNRKKETLPFKLIKNLIIIPIEINGKGPYNFVLDTGVGFCIITDPSLLDTINPGHLRKIKIAGFGEGADLTAHVIPSLFIKIGNLAANHVSAAVLEEDAFNLSSFAGIPVYGLIGYDFFNSFIVRVNYASSLLTMYRYQTGFRLKKGYRIPMTIEDRKSYINAELAIPGVKSAIVKLIIDTGAGHPLSLEATDETSFKLPDKTISANLGIGISGPISGLLGRIRLLRLGKFEIKDVLTAYPSFSNAAAKAQSIKRAGSIGNGILRRFEVVFDYSRNTLYLKPTASLKTPFEHDMSGMELYSSGEGYKRLFVLRVEAASAAFEAGISEDDEILAINFKPVTEIGREEIDALFKSKDDRSIILDLIPKGSAKMERIILTLKRRI